MIEQLGPYQIQELLSRGGMGTVYKAYHPALDRHVAIKVLASRFSADPSFVERFQKEARIVARLEHPHILPVYDFASDEDTAYLVMKLVEGTSLYAHIGPRGMSPERAIQILIPVSQALAHAHRRNIVHRDIKPDNILIDESDWIYLTDFGMAKMVTAAGPTGEGTILGTPEYMAPEQAQGKSIDHRADIYSLTVLVFHLLTGKLPFKGNHPVATIKQLIYDPFPEITEHNPSLPKLLDPLLQKGAAKNPEDRFGDVMEYVKMLEAVLSSATIPKTRELFIRKFRLAVLPFTVGNSEKAWMSTAVQEMLGIDLAQSLELYLMSGDQVGRACRNISGPNEGWTNDMLQRFFELSRVDYVITGSVDENRISYAMKISTTFETVVEGVVEGTIPFHLASAVAQKIRARLEVKETKIVSLEQIFGGNVAMLQQYSNGIQSFREGKFVDADRALRLALKHEPNFVLAHIYLARVLKDRGLIKQAQESARNANLPASGLPIGLLSLMKAQWAELSDDHQNSVEIYREFHNQFPEVIEFLVLWGEALVSADRLDEAANVFYEICEKEGRLGLGWQRLAWIEFLQDKFEQSWYHYKRAQRLYSAYDHTGGMAATCMGLAEISKKRMEWNTAADYYGRAAEGFTKLLWRKGTAEAKYQLALALKQQGTFAEVLALLKDACDLYHQCGDLRGEVLCLREILEEPLETSEALEFSDRAIVAASELEDEALLASIVPLKLRWNIEAEQPDAALRAYGSYYQVLINQSPDLHFPLAQIQVTRALMLQNRLDEARKQIEQAVRILGRTNSPHLTVKGMLIRCELFLREGQRQTAEDYVDAAGLIAEKIADKELVYEVDMMRARILKSEGERVKLLQVYLHAMKLAEDLGRSTQIHKLKDLIDQLRVVKN
jgi:serine/threonine protein kinase/tetratricopeptide (TPR) repeat protein